MLQLNDPFEMVVAAALLLQTPHQREAMRERAIVLEPLLDAEFLQRLARQLRPAPPLPETFRPHQTGSGARTLGWELTWDKTLEEIFVQCRERGLPPLGELAFREETARRSDPGGAWAPEEAAQARSFHILCRLAAEGVAQEQFLEDVRFSLPRMPPAAQVLMVDALESLRLKGLLAAETAFGAGLATLTRLPSYRQAKRTILALDGDQT